MAVRNAENEEGASRAQDFGQPFLLNFRVPLDKPNERETTHIAIKSNSGRSHICIH